MSEVQHSEEEPITDKVHRTLAVSLFNSTWDLIDKEVRSSAEDDTMINGAHASLYHWSKVGGPQHLAVGHWQVSHVYTLLRHGQSALYHASRCLDICNTHNIADWRLAFAYEAMARAYAALNDSESCWRYRAKATEAGTAIAALGDCDHFQSELAKGPWFAIG